MLLLGQINQFSLACHDPHWYTRLVYAYRLITINDSLGSQATSHHVGYNLIVDDDHFNTAQLIMAINANNIPHPISQTLRLRHNHR